MKHEIQNNPADQKIVKSTGQAEKAFAYNFLLPDLALFVFGITGAFGALLTVFS